ncbi:hypothetical protein Pint_07449 [Pistacia integerrima]|uniref:Uncharacterized protein n=1 Tax=Pistacia integerrima TaxID=434235 RepID=A0ACC0XVR0_9ROSI|nr:hypothetical protein Pint_07449 [Pistacia integerrima]
MNDQQNSSLLHFPTLADQVHEFSYVNPSANPISESTSVLGSPTTHQPSNSPTVSSSTNQTNQSTSLGLTNHSNQLNESSPCDKSPEPIHLTVALPFDTSSFKLSSHSDSPEGIHLVVDLPVLNDTALNVALVLHPVIKYLKVYTVSVVVVLEKQPGSDKWAKLPV